jgi:hypothetical protein
VVLLALSLHGYSHMSMNALTWLSLILIPVLVLVCAVMCRRRECRLRKQQTQSDE